MIVPELVALPLKTADGRPLVHKFYRQSGTAVGLLVVFPGNHYGVDGPLLYYPCEILGAEGWDTLAVSYGFQTAMKEPLEDGLVGLIEECRSAVLAVLAGREYPRIGLVGKSLGAGIVAHLCVNQAELASARVGYLTPALGTPFFDPLFVKTQQAAYLALGTRDRFYSSEAVEQLRAQKPFELALIEGADHSMDIPGNLKGSIEAVGQAVGGLLAFVRSNG